MFPVCVQWCARHAAAVAGGAVASLAVASLAVAGGAVASLAVAADDVASIIATVPHLLQGPTQRVLFYRLYICVCVCVPYSSGPAHLTWGLNDAIQYTSRRSLQYSS